MDKVHRGLLGLRIGKVHRGQGPSGTRSIGDKVHRGQKSRIAVHDGTRNGWVVQSSELLFIQMVRSEHRDDIDRKD